MSVRVRIAPSPTGAMHIGLVRTGLFNYLFARHHGGALVLRIEDTDQERSTPESTATILDGMRWLGLDWDEGPFFQTQRTTLYRAQADRLLEHGRAYRCWCTPATRQKLGSYTFISIGLIGHNITSCTCKSLTVCVRAASPKRSEWEGYPGAPLRSAL